MSPFSLSLLFHPSHFHSSKHLFRRSSLPLFLFFLSFLSCFSFSFVSNFFLPSTLRIPSLLRASYLFSLSISFPFLPFLHPTPLSFSLSLSLLILSVCLSFRSFLINLFFFLPPSFLSPLHSSILHSSFSPSAVSFHPFLQFYSPYPSSFYPSFHLFISFFLPSPIILVYYFPIYLILCSFQLPFHPFILSSFYASLPSSLMLRVVESESGDWRSWMELAGHHHHYHLPADRIPTGRVATLAPLCCRC